MNAYYDIALKEFRLNELVRDETIKIFNYGNCKRDFIYVDDIVEGAGLRADSERGTGSCKGSAGRL